MIGFLQECVRWFDHWLKGRENGVMDEPKLLAWMQDWVPPAGHHATRPGRWVAEPAWPPPSVDDAAFELGGPARHRSPESAPRPGRRRLVPRRRAGRLADRPARRGRPLAVLHAPAARAAAEILGFPEVELSLEVDRPSALVAVRLCAVAPEGESLLVTRGLLNLTHRDSHEHIEPLEPGRRYDVRVRLDAIAHVVPAGHALRVSVSTVYWPWAWPSPEPVTLTLHGGRLLLPEREPRGRPAAAFRAARAGRAARHRGDRAGRHHPHPHA